MSGTDCATSEPPNAIAPAAIMNVMMRFIMASLPSTGCARGLRMERDLLNPPLGDFRDVHLVRIPAIHLVHGAEFLEAVARLAEAAQHGAVELHLVDLAGHRGLIEVVAGREGIRRVDVLMRSLRN